jgi:hypothetical protein
MMGSIMMHNTLRMSGDNCVYMTSILFFLLHVGYVPCVKEKVPKHHSNSHQSKCQTLLITGGYMSWTYQAPKMPNEIAQVPCPSAEISVEGKITQV